MAFSPATEAWFTSTFAEPTAAQEQGWAAIERGEHTLILAPTGSGKTLAAFLWAIDRLLNTPPGPGGCRVLYVSPLKALTYDVERNLQAPLEGIARHAQRLGVALPAIRVATRSGDTPPEERRAMAKHPPDILITTPESLYLLLTSQAASILDGVEQVIVDEIHSVAGTKRGAHLALSLERLDLRCRSAQAGRSPQRIGLSATQRPLHELARYLGGLTAGVARPVSIVDTGSRKALELEIVVPVQDMGPALYPRLLELIYGHRSTLIFVNSRRLAERLAAQLNEVHGQIQGLQGSGEDAPVELVRAHHGSIAREQRLEIEAALKGGRLPALVATSSLELGIDMGAIDLVVQVEAPTSVASGLQRIGRAGHQVGQPSKGRIFPKFRHDLLVCAVVVQRMHAGLVEETSVPRNALDVLAQQVVATVAGAGSPLAVPDLEDMVRSAYPYADLPTETFEGVLDMLAGRYPSDEFAELRPRLIWDRVAGTVVARPGARMLAVTSGGTIPDRGLYGVFTPEGSRVGELDEEMVYESRVGETFVLGATTWRIEEITRDRVVVVPAPGLPGKMPFWHGDTQGRPFELGVAVGAFTAQLAAGSLSDDELRVTCDLHAWAAGQLRDYVAEEMAATGGVVPTDRQIVVERFRDELGDWRVAVLSPFGARVHAPWALAIEARIRRRGGAEAQAVWSDDGIIVRLPAGDEAPTSEEVLLGVDELDELIVDAVGSSALFAGRFRENAARALLLPRRRPGSRTPLWQLRQRAADLLAVASRYGQFPIVLETYRECLQDVFDLPALRRLLADIEAHRVRVAAVELDAPSPFASGLVFNYVAAFMYEGDAPLAERRAQALTLDRRMLAELLGSDELRDLLDAGALAQLERQLQALDERRRATSLDQAADLLRRLGDLSPSELQQRCVPELTDPVRSLLAGRRAIVVSVAGQDRLIAVEDAGRYRDGLGVALPTGLPAAYLEEAPDALVQLVRRWARVHGPFTAREPAARLGIDLHALLEVLRRLVADGRLEHGAFRPDGREEEWCDVEVLRMARQRSLALLRQEVEPAAPAALTRFLPAWHGIAPVGALPADGGPDRLWEVIGQLQGVALAASVWESDILPSRVRDYHPRLLDELLASGDVMWVGAGALGGHDGRVVLVRREDAALLLPRLGVIGELSRPVDQRPCLPVHDELRRVLDERGACYFRDLCIDARRPDHDVLEALWDLVWAGEVTNDGLAALRATVGGGSGGGRGAARARRAAAVSRRPRPGLAGLGPARGQGRWSLVERELGSVQQPGGARATEAGVAVVNLLLQRHGVLTGDAVRGEALPGGFSGIYPVLRTMEESGRIRRGYFVAGMGGAQFALPGAVDRLRRAREVTTEQPTVLAATDPANTLGLSLPWPVRGPQRVAGAHVVAVEGIPSLYVERGGKGLVALRPTDGTWERAAVGALVQLVATRRWGRLQVARYPEALEGALREAAFVPTPKGLVLYA